MNLIRIDERRPEKILKRVEVGKTGVDVLLKSTKKYYDVNVERYRKFYDEDGFSAAVWKDASNYIGIPKASVSLFIFLDSFMNS